MKRGTLVDARFGNKYFPAKVEKTWRGGAKKGYVQVGWVEEESFSDVLLKHIKLRNPPAHISGRKRKGSGADVKPEFAAADSKRPRSAQAKPEHIVVTMNDGATCALRKEMVVAFLNIAAHNAARCQRRFNAARDYGILDAEDAQRKCYFWRELDRHSMFYLRAYFNLVNGLRSQESSAAARTPLLPCTASLGELSDEEAEALVLAVIAFRFTNNMLGWVRYDQLRGAETQSVSEWKDTLRRSRVAEKKAEKEPKQDSQEPTAASTLAIMRARRTSSLLASDKFDAPRAQALTATRILDYRNYVEARRDTELSKFFKVFTGQHQAGHTVDLDNMLQHLSTPSMLKELTGDLRRAETGGEVMTRLMRFNGVGNFFAYQIYLDLSAAPISLWRGGENEAAHVAQRFTFGRFGSGSLTGAHCMRYATAPTRGKQLAQAEAMEIAGALVKLGQQSFVNGKLQCWFEENCTEAWQSFQDSIEGVAPGAELGWDMQSVENLLCGVRETAKGGVEMMRKAVDSVQGQTSLVKGARSWKPNPVTDAEWRETYGGSRVRT